MNATAGEVDELTAMLVPDIGTACLAESRGYCAMKLPAWAADNCDCHGSYANPALLVLLTTVDVVGPCTPYLGRGSPTSDEALMVQSFISSGWELLLGMSRPSAMTCCNNECV